MNLIEEGLVALGTEEVADVETAFLPGFFGGLLKLPVVEARTEAGSNWLVFVRSFVMAKSAIRQPQSLW